MKQTSHDPRPLPAAALVLVAAGVVGAVLSVGDVLATSPPLAPPSDVSAWADGRDPLDVVAGAARLLVLGLGSLLGVVGAANLVAALTTARTARAVAERVTPRVLALALAGSVIGAGPAAAGTDRSEPSGPGRGARMELVETTDGPRTWLPRADTSSTSGRGQSPGAAASTNASDPGATGSAPTPAAPTTTAGSRAEPGGADDSTAATPGRPWSDDAVVGAVSDSTGRTPTRADARAPAPDPPTPPPPVQIDLDTDIASHTLARHHVVRPGEHLWSIAADVVDRLVDRSDERAHVRYWQRLIDANRQRFVDPANPSLIHPGLELVLPDPNGPGG